IAVAPNREWGEIARRWYQAGISSRLARRARATVPSDSSQTRVRNPLHLSIESNTRRASGCTVFGWLPRHRSGLKPSRQASRLGFRRVVALGRLLALGRLVQPLPERLQTLTEVAHHLGQATGAEDHQGDCACPLTLRAPRSGRWWRSGRWRNCPPRGRPTPTRSCSPLEARRS